MFDPTIAVAERSPSSFFTLRCAGYPRGVRRAQHKGKELEIRDREPVDTFELEADLCRQLPALVRI
jgi:hypothetical protein